MIRCRRHAGGHCGEEQVGMVERLGWYTPVGSTMVGFMFLALEKIGRPRGSFRKQDSRRLDDGNHDKHRD